MSEQPPSTEVKSQSTSLEKREEFLREEVKNHRAHLFSLMQWGMTLLAAVESSLYFIRRDLAQALSHNQFTVPAQAFTLPRWFFGTFILVVISGLFSLLLNNLLKRYYSYRDQLNQAAGEFSKIADGDVKRKFRWIPLAFFWAFPALDVLVWLFFHK